MVKPADATPKELAGIDELRTAALAELGLESVEKAPADTSALLQPEALLRFHRARNSLKASTAMLVASARWREESHISSRVRQWRERLASGDDEAASLIASWPSGCCGRDLRGAPVYYARYGTCDMESIASGFGMEQLTSCAMSEQREIEESLDELAATTGEHPVQVICVADLYGLDFGRARRGLPIFKTLQKLLDDNFPERLHVAFVLRAPWIFAALYKLVSPFLAADTKRKVRILGKGDDHLAALQQYVAFEEIPDFLGGGKPCIIPDGRAASMPKQAGADGAATYSVPYKAELGPTPSTEDVVALS